MTNARARPIDLDAPTDARPEGLALEGASGVRVFALAPFGIVVVDERGTILDVNPRALRDFAYERSELVGASIEVLVPDERRAHHAAARAPFHPGPRHGMGMGRHLAARRKDGSTFPAEIALSELGDGRTAAFVVDITERRRAEEALIQAEAQLRVSDKLASLGMLCAGMAHEINNPLSVILGDIEALSDDVDEEVRREALGDLRDAAERIRNVARDMRLFARGDEDARALPIDPRRVIESSLRMARYEIRHRAQIVKDLQPVPFVEGNESRLGQVFVNLLVNAVQSISGAGPRPSEIRLRTRAGPGPSAIIEIADTGCGMSDDARLRLFEPFVTTKVGRGGAGLGLSICHRVVTSMGGTIEVESAVGAGTLVRVTLPASPRTEEAKSAVHRVACVGRK